MKHIIKQSIVWAMFCGLAWPVWSQASDLVQAVQTSNSAAVARALDQGQDPNQTLPDGASLLAWAVEMQSPEIVAQLLAAGADVDGVNRAVGNQSWPPLFVACTRGHDAILRQLLAAGVAVNAEDTATGVSALAKCAATASPEVLSALLAGGAEVNAVDQKGQTALMHAAAAGNLDNLHLLLAAGAKLNVATKANFTALFFALKSGNAQAAMALLEAGANSEHIGPEQTSVVQMALYQKQYAVAKKLIEQGADLTAYDRNGLQLLHAAVQAQQVELVDLLLKKGADPNALTGPSTLTWRYEVNFTSAPYVVYPTTALLMAAKLGNAEMMQRLVAGGADTSFKQEDGTNVLLAASQSNASALKMALALHNNVNTVNASGRAPLHLLMNIGTDSPIPRAEIKAMFQLLADHGARVDLADSNGNTPIAQAQSIHYWAQKEFFSVFQPVSTDSVL